MAQTPSTWADYVGDGVKDTFQVTFPYQKQQEVFVTVDGAPAAFTFISAGWVQLAAAPANGAAIRVQRSTEAFEPRHEFANGVPLLPRFIDENNKQFLYVVQEAVNETAGVAADALSTAEGAVVIAQAASDKVDAATLDSALVLRQELAGDGGAAMIGRGVVAVDSVADLLALPEGQRREDLRYLVTSYHGEWAAEVPYRGPRGGGEFYWSPTHPRSFHNGITVIDPDAAWDGSKGALDSFFSHAGSGNGCFMRRVTGVLNLHDCGASGDGSTDDTVPAQAGLDYIGKLGGGCLLVPEADFLVTNLIMKYASISVKAMGPRSCFLRPNDFTALHRPTIWIARNHCSVIGVRFTYTGWDSTNMASLLTMRPDGNSYYGCHIAVGYTEMWTAINTGVYHTLFGVQLQVVRDTLIDGVRIVGAAIHGIALMNAVGNEVRNCNIREFKGTGIYGYIAPESDIHHNRLKSSRDDAIYLGGSDAHMNGVWTPLTTDELVDVSIHHNKAFKIGAKAFSASGYSGVSIQHNFLNECRTSAIFTGNEPSQGVSASRNVDVAHNTLIGAFGGFGEASDGYGYSADIVTAVGGVHFAIDLSQSYTVSVSENLVVRSPKVNGLSAARLGFGLDTLRGATIEDNRFYGFQRGNLGGESSSGPQASGVALRRNKFRNEEENSAIRFVHIGGSSYDIDLEDNDWHSVAVAGGAWAAIWFGANVKATLRGGKFDLPNGLAMYARAETPIATIEVSGIRNTQSDVGRPSSIGRREVWSSGAPSLGTWERGDVAWNDAPSAGGVAGWVCVAGGTPGTWKAMATLAV
jgi:hypothetical protein